MSLEVVSITQIEPCRCGGTALDIAPGGDEYEARCSGCGIWTSGGSNPVEAIVVWNSWRRRPALRKPVAGDPINPPHYKSHPAKCQCGRPIECIDVVRHFGFSVGNAIKYLWRAGVKGDAIEDLTKARWYIDDEIAKRKKEADADGD